MTMDNPTNSTTMTPQERAAFIADIAAAIRGRATDTSLSDDEQRWVRLAIQREAQSIKLRQAVIEKTTVGLVWALILWVGVVFFEWSVKHGYKP